MAKYKLERTGRRPVVFEGEELASKTWKVGTGRADKVTLYRTRGGALVVHVINMTSWEGERDNYEVYTFDGAESLADWAEAHHYPVALELLEDAGFEVVETID